jgi:hypothetical protein
MLRRVLRRVLSWTRLAKIFFVSAILLGALVMWFSSNFFYSLFWAYTDKWQFKEADAIAYTLAHLTPFVLTVLLVIGLYFVVRYEITRQVCAETGATEEKSTPSNLSALEINYGEDGPFERLLSTDMSRLQRMLLVEFKNAHPHTALTHCKLEITSIEPFMGLRRPLVLRDNFPLAGGDHVFIPLVTYGESRSSDRSAIADTAIAVCAPEGQSPNFLAALPHDVENILTIRGTAIGSAYCEEKVVVWVGAGTRLRIRKYEGSINQGEYVSLENATREAYGAARNTDIGLSAERMNTNGVLAWFAHYYHVQGIPVYGNVRDSTRVEPVLFRHVDIKMENDKLIGKEIYSDLSWENMQVKKSDHARLLKILRDHTRALKDI